MQLQVNRWLNWLKLYSLLLHFPLVGVLPLQDSSCSLYACVYTVFKPCWLYYLGRAEQVEGCMDVGEKPSVNLSVIFGGNCMES